MNEAEVWLEHDSPLPDYMSEAERLIARAETAEAERDAAIARAEAAEARVAAVKCYNPTPHRHPAECTFLRAAPTERAGLCRCEHPYIGTQAAGEPVRCEVCRGLVARRGHATTDPAPSTPAP